MLLLYGEALLHPLMRCFIALKTIIERGEPVFERRHAALEAIKAMPKIAHFDGQRQNAGSEKLQT
jgi:hypothetical protein